MIKNASCFHLLQTLDAVLIPISQTDVPALHRFVWNIVPSFQNINLVYQTPFVTNPSFTFSTYS